jgi:LemA protein
MLQEELSGIENKIAYSRQFYNDTVMSYNMKIQQFPDNAVASIFGFAWRDYFKPPAEEAEAVKKPVKVKFD